MKYESMKQKARKGMMGGEACLRGTMAMERGGLDVY